MTGNCIHPSIRKLFGPGIVVLILLLSTVSTAQQYNRLNTPAGRIFFAQENDQTYRLRDIFTGSDDSTHSENPRLVAIALNITLGLLGVHRLYLGTDLKVPILYTLTLGGGGILWLVDLGLLIFTPDITPYMDHPGVFMWTGK